MERLCRQDHGLFPKPMDIRFSCSCPDWASMCKHVAAVLYGIGSRLDEKPELLFRLRSVDEKDLVANLDAAVPLSKTAPAAGRLLEVDDAAALFGLDMVGEESSVPSGSNVPPASTPAAKTRQARAGGNTGAPRKSSAIMPTVDHTQTKSKRTTLKIDHTHKQAQPTARVRRHHGRERADRFVGPAPINPAPAAPPKPNEVSAPLSASRNAESEKRAIKRYKAAQTVVATEPIQPPAAIAEAEFAKPRTGFMKSKASAQSASPKSAIELTSDGFVKWWK